VAQRAATAAELVPVFAEEARRRQIDAGKDGAEGGRGHKKVKPAAKNHAEGEGKSAEQATRFIRGVSVGYVETVLSLKKKEPGVLKKIKDGQLTIRDARVEVNKLFSPRSLCEQYIAPPFSVFDSCPTAFVLGCRADSSLGFFRVRKVNVALPLGRRNIPSYLLGVVCREKFFDEVYHLGRVIFRFDLTREVAPVFRARLGFHGAILPAQLMLVTRCYGQN